MKATLLVFLGLVGAATASPSPINTSTRIPLRPRQGEITKSAIAKIRSLLEERTERSSGNILKVLLEFLHLLGITDAEILKVILEVMWVTPRVEEQLTFVDKMKLENAGVDFMLTLTDPRSLNFNKELGNLLVMKSVVYPYVPPNLQNLLNEIEKILMVIWELLGE